MANELSIRLIGIPYKSNFHSISVGPFQKGLDYPKKKTRNFLKLNNNSQKVDVIHQFNKK